MIFAKWQFVHPVAGESVPLIEAGKPAVGGNVEGVLRDNGAATADRGSIIDRFGISVSPRNRDSVCQALAQANRSRMKNRIARGGFVGERLHPGDGVGPLDVEPRSFRPVIVE